MANIVLWFSTVTNGIIQILILIHYDCVVSSLEWIVVFHAVTSFMNHGFSFHWWKVADRVVATLMASAYFWIAPFYFFKVWNAVSIFCFLKSKLLHHYRYTQAANFFHICSHCGVSIYTYFYMRWKLCIFLLPEVPSSSLNMLGLNVSKELQTDLWRVCTFF